MTDIYLVCTVPNEPKAKPQFFAGQDEMNTVLFMADWRKGVAMSHVEAIETARTLTDMFSLRKRQFAAISPSEYQQQFKEIL